MLYIGGRLNGGVNPLSVGAAPLSVQPGRRDTWSMTPASLGTTVRGLRTASAVGTPRRWPVPVGDRLREILQPEQDPDGDPDPADQVGESVDAAQRRRAADEWLRRRLLERQLHDGASLRISVGVAPRPVARRSREGRGLAGPDRGAAGRAARVLQAAGRGWEDLPTADRPGGAGPRAARAGDQIGVELDIEVSKPAKDNDSVRWPRARHICGSRMPDRAADRPGTSVRRSSGCGSIGTRGTWCWRSPGCARHLNYMLDQARPLEGEPPTSPRRHAGKTGTIKVRIP